MDIQFVLTEEDPIFEFKIPAERNNSATTCLAVISGIAPEIEEDSEAEPPVDAVPANTVALQYAIPAAVDATCGSGFFFCNPETRL